MKYSHKIKINQFREHKWIQTCNQINEQQGKTYWQQIKKLSKYKIKYQVPDLAVEGQTLEKDEEKAEAFAKHFKKAFQEDRDPNFDQQLYIQVSQWYEEYFDISTDQVQNQENFNIPEQRYFNILNSGKSTAPGIDSITKDILRKLPIDIHHYIIKMYEFCFKNIHVPECWKRGTIITIAKPNTDTSRPASYRPITLLPVLSKNFEKLIK